VFNAVDQGTDGAALGVAGAAQPHQFSTHPILLCGEFQCDMRDGIEVCLSAGGRVQTPGVDEEVCVAEAKGCGVGIVGAGILAWPEEEEEAQEQHVADRGGLG